ncbi:MAG TPA: aspartate aminotransferase family protein [Myxococcaceae bacterium]|nr:aspartate aminotransferase family protein [Myxococcaceae bacterium]
MKSVVQYPEGHVLLRSLVRPMPVIARGEGIYLFDTDGKRYVDASSGAMVVSVGHGNRHVADAMHAQLMKVGYVNGTHFTSEPTEELAERLDAHVQRELPAFGASRAAFLCSGSEAVEAAIKFTRQLWMERGEAQRTKIIARTPGYHGNTLYALSASGRPHYRTLYGPLLSKVLTTRAPVRYRSGLSSWDEAAADVYVDELRALIESEGPESICAFIAEPVIGSSAGAAVPPPGYFAKIRELCDRYGILIIADEVLAGTGRCGTFFASHLTGLTPDVIVLGKGLGGGCAPLSSVIVRQAQLEEVRVGSGAFSHAQTYLQAPFITAAGVAVLDYFEKEQLLSHVTRVGQMLQQALTEALAPLPHVGCVQGVGLLAGVELVADKATREPFPRSQKVAERLAATLFERGLIVWPNVGQANGVDGDLFMVAPPLVIKDDQIGDLAAALKKALEEFKV